jgi:hypothetical protein
MILDIGISFPTLVDRRHYSTVLPESIVHRVIEMQQNERSHFYHRRPIATSAGKDQEILIITCTRQEKTDRNVGNALCSYPYSSG